MQLSATSVRGSRWCAAAMSTSWVPRINRAASQAQKAVYLAKAIADAHVEAQHAAAAVREHARRPAAGHSATANIKGVPTLQPADEMCNAVRKVVRRAKLKEPGANVPAAKLVRLRPDMSCINCTRACNMRCIGCHTAAPGGTRPWGRPAVVCEPCPRPLPCNHHVDVLNGCL